jgi:hypothetical protein
LVEFTANQSLNFMEVFHPVNPAVPVPFSRLTSNLNLNFSNFVSQTTYYYYADDRVSPSRSVVATSATAILERATHQKVLTYDRSLSVGYTFSRIVGLTPTSNMSATLNFSLNDFILPSASVTYDLLHNQLLSASLKVVLQSLSRCWKATTMVTYNTGYGVQWTGNEILLNLTGSGFGSVTDIANEIQSN